MVSLHTSPLLHQNKISTWTGRWIQRPPPPTPNPDQAAAHNHTPYAEMISAAIMAAKERNASSKRAIPFISVALLFAAQKQHTITFFANKMLTLSLSCSSLSTNNKLLAVRTLNSHQSRAISPVSQQLRKQHQFSGVSYNPLRVSVMNNRGRRFGAVCYSAPIAPRNLLWISTISTSVLMLARGTAIHKSFLVPLFVLQAPASIVSWMKSEYGTWTAFLAILVRLFFFIPGELELPFLTLLSVIVSPHQIMRLRGTQEGVILSLVIAAYLAFQHFTRAGSLGRSFDQGSIIATLATICIVVVPCLLLI